MHTAQMKTNKVVEEYTDHNSERFVIAVSEGPEGQGSKGENCCISINGEQRFVGKKKIHIHSIIFKGDHWRFL